MNKKELLKVLESIAEELGWSYQRRYAAIRRRKKLDPVHYNTFIKKGKDLGFELSLDDLEALRN